MSQILFLQLPLDFQKQKANSVFLNKKVLYVTEEIHCTYTRTSHVMEKYSRVSSLSLSRGMAE